ncbi:alternate-type signal peptide domain-containing protein [Cryobacterium algoricola]|uniref:Alternate-type signal peptide domain-containing protein n=1 Tax=Cryobacterium algoricola TaxID=1259183 RepID=A0ABY2IEB3_9MICO|nr:alternate-type signal peptide domain-containing protein [Cryobacterium algoricola]TFB87206.1 alternate-type signal peptide domain-containing protein [Cryobacterium algoricola]
MNKLLKGSIAGAVGVALLLGGAGTLAQWNSSAAAGSGATITAGTLVITPSGVGAWTSGGKSIDPSTFKAVPGDSLTYTKTVKITATGDNLTATLALAPGSFAPVSVSPALTAPADLALSTYLTNSASIALSGVTGFSGSGSSYTVTPGATGINGVDAVVTVTVKFPKNGTAGDSSEAATKLGSVKLSDLAITITQG